MPRAPEQQNTEDTMDDASYDDWETVSEGFGTKIMWDVGKTFVGTFTGTRTVSVDDKEDGFTDVLAAEFQSNGTKYWCWLPYALEEIINTDDPEKRLSPGEEVYIKCTGEEPTKRNLNPVKVFTIKRRKN